jgi:hypothetical protein
MFFGCCPVVNRILLLNPLTSDRSQPDVSKWVEPATLARGNDVLVENKTGYLVRVAASSAQKAKDAVWDRISFFEQLTTTVSCEE